jgi:hypothetical protein
MISTCPTWEQNRCNRTSLNNRDSDPTKDRKSHQCYEHSKEGCYHRFFQQTSMQCRHAFHSTHCIQHKNWGLFISLLSHFTKSSWCYAKQEIKSRHITFSPLFHFISLCIRILHMLFSAFCIMNWPHKIRVMMFNFLPLVGNQSRMEICEIIFFHDRASAQLLAW